MSLFSVGEYRWTRTPGRWRHYHDASRWTEWSDSHRRRFDERLLDEQQQQRLGDEGDSEVSAR
jgi:hypothetical protein